MEPTRNPFAGVLTSWKTSLPAVLSLTLTLLQQLGVTHFSVEATITINALLLAVVGLFARDANKSSEGATVEPAE